MKNLNYNILRRDAVKDLEIKNDNQSHFSKNDIDIETENKNDNNEMLHGGSESGTVSPIDDYADTYNSFVGDPSTWKNAIPYDPTLAKYYNVNGKSKYNLQTVAQLYQRMDPPVTIPANYYVNTHYGDWPAPEIFVINVK